MNIKEGKRQLLVVLLSLLLALSFSANVFAENVGPEAGGDAGEVTETIPGDGEDAGETEDNPGDTGDSGDVGGETGGEAGDDNPGSDAGGDTPSTEPENKPGKKPGKRPGKKPPQKKPAVVSKNSAMGKGAMKVTWIRVGAGDSVLVEFPNGQNMIVDGGLARKHTHVIDILKKHKINYMKYVVSTHGHDDHTGGLDHVIHHFADRNSTLFYSGKAGYGRRQAKQLMRAAKKKKMKKIYPRRGYKISEGGATVEFVQTDTKYRTHNKNSLALCIQYKGRKILLTGDNSLGSQYKIKKFNVDAMDAPHHGARNAAFKGTYTRFHPNQVIVSADGHTWGHPSYNTFLAVHAANPKARVYCTYRHGDITITVSKHGGLSNNKAGKRGKRRKK